MKNVTDFRKTVEIVWTSACFTRISFPRIPYFSKKEETQETKNLGIQKCYCYGEKNQKNSHFGKT